MYRTLIFFFWQKWIWWNISLSLTDAVQSPPIPVSDHPTAMLWLVECHQSDCLSTVLGLQLSVFAALLTYTYVSSIRPRVCNVHAVYRVLPSTTCNSLYSSFVSTNLRTENKETCFLYPICVLDVWPVVSCFGWVRWYAKDLMGAYTIGLHVPIKWPLVIVFNLVMRAVTGCPTLLDLIESLLTPGLDLSNLL